MNVNELIREWFLHSYNNLVSAKHLFDDLYPKQIDISCYLCQQCVETALKGYLQFTGIEPEKIHNLRELCELCIEHDNSFKNIISYCADLTIFSNATRYPNELATDEATAKSVIEKAKSIYEFCLSKIPEECNPKDDKQQGK
ncbi:HEPN domain-containing protein [Treponema primitia]|uniref:HEPN domain-containing protein n=1 Tax=Treponema primitia TaxID=88058 RepID=UPI00397F16DB